MSMQKVIFRVYAVSFGEGGGLAPSMDSFSSPLFTYIANRLTNDNLDKTSLVDGLACASD